MDQKFDNEYGELEDAVGNAKEAQSLVDIAGQVVHDNRVDYIRLCGDFEDAEKDQNEGSECVLALVGKTAATTSALSVGINDRDGRQMKYYQDALSLIKVLLCCDIREELELVALDNSPFPL